MVLILSISVFILVTTLFVLDMNRDQNINSNVSTYFQPLFAETIVTHNYSASPESIWDQITKFSDYNFWFPGILRILPVVETDRFVHQYSFDKFQLAPGSLIKVRPFSLSPLFSGRVISVRANKKLSMEVRFNPFHKETIIFDLEKISEGTSVTCKRSSKGVFSWMSIWGFTQNKSQILNNLGYLIDEEIIVEEPPPVSTPQASSPVESGGLVPGFANRDDIIAYVVNKSLDGDDEPLNSVTDKVTRGKAKAMLIKINRGSIDRPIMPEAPSGPASPTSVSTPQASAPVESGGLVPGFANRDDIIAYVVNKSLDGDDEPLNSVTDKVTRGKAKAMLIKINRGSIDRPIMPEAPSGPASAAPDSAPAPQSAEESTTSKNDNSESDLIERLVAAGLDGNMDEINALDDRVLRGKIKAAIVKAKRAATN